MVSAPTPTIRAFGIEDEGNDYDEKESLMTPPFALEAKVTLT